jgi:hypothetical protein
VSEDTTLLDPVDLLPDADDSMSDPIPIGPAKPTDPLVKRLPKAAAKFDPKLKLRYYTPSVAKHIAKIYVHKADGDMSAAVEWLRPGFSDAEYEAYAKYLLRQEQVKVAINREYAEIGIDEEGKKKFIGELWKAVIEGKGKYRETALPLLGRAIGINEMQEDGRQIQELPIKGMKEGWQRMTGKDAELAQQATGFDTLKEPESEKKSE